MTYGDYHSQHWMMYGIVKSVCFTPENITLHVNYWFLKSRPYFKFRTSEGWVLPVDSGDLQKDRLLWKTYILRISKHRFGNCILTLISLVLSGILPQHISPHSWAFSTYFALQPPFSLLSGLQRSPSFWKCLSLTSLLL